MKFLIPFLAVAAFVFVADYIWLGVLMKGFYQQEIGSLMRRDPAGAFSPRLLPAFIVYLLIPLGIILFPASLATNGSIRSALLWGGIFGFAVYGIYDFSNLAVLENWNWRVTAADVIWGTFLCGTSTVIAVFTRRLLTA